MCRYIVGEYCQTSVTGISHSQCSLSVSPGNMQAFHSGNRCCSSQTRRGGLEIFQGLSPKLSGSLLNANEQMHLRIHWQESDSQNVHSRTTFLCQTLLVPLTACKYNSGRAQSMWLIDPKIFNDGERADVPPALFYSVMLLWKNLFNKILNMEEYFQLT